MGNVFTHSGYTHCAKFLKRSGKSKISLQKIVKSLQKNFLPEEWYYFRKIHKKDKNYFLNKGGQRGDHGGGGWITLDTKTSKSTTSRISSKSGVSSIEETKSGVIHNSHSKSGTSSLAGVKHSHGGLRPGGRGTRHHGRIRTLSNSEVSSSKGSHQDEAMAAAEISDDDSWTVSHDMLVVDEVHTSEESDENVDAYGRHKDSKNRKPTFFNLGIASENAEMRVDEAHSDISSDWNNSSNKSEEWTKVVHRLPRKHIELKDLTENDFLSMISDKN